MLTEKYPIFIKWPHLRQHIAHITLTRLPSPVSHLEALGKVIGLSELWVKKDDECSDVFGGNKPRKLEFVLSDAQKRKKRWVVTRGGVGSNHCLATAIFAKILSLRCCLLLGPGPEIMTDEMRQNLLLCHQFGARIFYLPYGRTKYWVALRAMLQIIIREKGNMPYNIAPGGSSVLGTLGYVNAGMELVEQVKEGAMPQPDYIVHASGSSGTLAGLLVAFKLLSFPARLIAVKTMSLDGRWARTEMVLRLATRTHEVLRRVDATIGLPKYSEQDFTFVDGLCGSRYGEPTIESEEAVKMAWDLEGISLDSVYTGKAVAALRRMVTDGEIGKNRILFWNTYGGANLKHLMGDLDYHGLPALFHRFFNTSANKI
jgi:D-cysteine desulfhydrase